MFLYSEFCGKENRDLEIEEEEIPQGDCFDFMLEAAPEPEAEGAAERLTGRMPRKRCPPATPSTA